MTDCNRGANFYIISAYITQWENTMYDLKAAQIYEQSFRDTKYQVWPEGRALLIYT